MKSLNRTLSLVLVLVMVLGLFGVAGAAFKDDAQIENTDAVNTMVALNIIEGKGNNTFDPVSTVKRGEMAKMICVALNGGKNPVLGTNTTPTYTDIKGHWAEAYIEYCTKLGIVAGKGDGTFDPEADVTGTEAAKMLLVALGYDAELEGYVGPAWAINVNVRANQNDLYTRLSSIDPNAGLSRDNAAQMIYNTLNAEVVALKADGTYGVKEVQTSVGDIVKTGTETWYKMTTIHASLSGLNNSEYKTYADADAAAKGVLPAAALGTDYTLAAVTRDVYGAVTVTQTTTETFGRKYLGLYTYTGIMTSVGYVENKGYTATVGAATFTELSDDPSAFIGQKVKVLHKYTDDVYGIYAHKDTTIADTTVLAAIATSLTDSDNTTVKAVTNGKTYKMDADVATDTSLPVIAPDGSYIGTVAALLGTAGNTNGNYVASLGSIVKLIDNDGNGKLDLAVLDYVELYKVNFVTDKEVTLVAAEGTKRNTGNVTSYKLDDIAAYDGMAKGDYVVFKPTTSNAKNEISLSKVETMTAKVEGVKTENNTNQARFGGVWMPIAPVEPTPGTYGDFVTGNTLTFVQVNGTIYSAEVKEASAISDFLVLKGFEVKYGAVYASAVLADGTTKEIELGKGSKTGAVDAFFAIKDNSGTPYADLDNNGSWADTDLTILPDHLYGYTVGSDGKYNLIDPTTVAAGSVKAVFGADGKGTSTLANNKFGTTLIAPTAKIIVKETVSGSTKYYVTTGAAVSAWAKTATSSSAMYVYTENNGYNYATTAFMAVTAEYSDSAANFGYVVDIYSTTVDGDAGKMFTIWNGTENVTAFAKNADTASAAKNDVVKFTSVKDGVIKIEAKYDLTDNAAAVAAKNDVAGLITFNNMGLNLEDSATAASAYEVTADTQIIFIDSTDKTAGAGKLIANPTIADISMANKDASGALTGDMNVMYVVGANKKGSNDYQDLKLVVVDVANKIDGVSTFALSGNTYTAEGWTLTVAPTTTVIAQGQAATYVATATGTATGTTSVATTFTGFPGTPFVASTTPAPTNLTLTGLTLTPDATGAVSGTYTVSAVPTGDVTVSIA